MAVPLIGLGASIVGNILAGRSRKKAAAANRDEINRAYKEAAQHYLGASAKEEDLFKWMLNSNIGTIKQGAAQGRSDILAGLNAAQGLLSPYSQAGQRSLGQTNFLLTGQRPPAETGGAFAPTPEFKQAPEFVNPPLPSGQPTATPAQAPVAQPQATPPGMPTQVPHFKRGGSVNTDTVPAMLTPGEFVFSKEAAQAIGHNKLKAMNDKHTPGRLAHTEAKQKEQMEGGGEVPGPGYADGGVVQPTYDPIRKSFNTPEMDNRVLYEHQRYPGFMELANRFGPHSPEAQAYAAETNKNIMPSGGVQSRNMLQPPTMAPRIQPQGEPAPIQQQGPTVPSVAPIQQRASLQSTTPATTGAEQQKSFYGKNFLTMAEGGMVVPPPTPDTGPGAGRAYPTTWNVNNAPQYQTTPDSITVARAPAPLPTGFNVATGGTRPQNQQVYGQNYFPGGLPGFENVKSTADFSKLSPEQQGAYRMALYQQHSTAPGSGGATYEASPLYQWQKAEGEKGINRALAARGRSDSSFGLNTLSNFYRGLAAEEADKQYNRQWQQTVLGANMASQQSQQLMQGAQMLASGAYKKAGDLTDAFTNYAKMQGTNIDSLAVRSAANRWLQANGIVDANNMSAGAQSAMWQYLSQIAGNVAVNYSQPNALKSPTASGSPYVGEFAGGLKNVQTGG